MTCSSGTSLINYAYAGLTLGSSTSPGCLRQELIYYPVRVANDTSLINYVGLCSSGTSGYNPSSLWQHVSNLIAKTEGEIRSIMQRWVADCSQTQIICVSSSACNKSSLVSRSVTAAASSGIPLHQRVQSIARSPRTSGHAYFTRSTRSDADYA